MADDPRLGAGPSFGLRARDHRKRRLIDLRRSEIRDRDAELGGEGGADRRRVGNLAEGRTARGPALGAPILDPGRTITELDDAVRTAIDMASFKNREVFRFSDRRHRSYLRRRVVDDQVRDVAAAEAIRADFNLSRDPTWGYQARRQTWRR